MSVYISGPMTGYPDFNRGAFMAAELAIATNRGDAWPIINPARIDLGPDARWEDYMRHHLAVIARDVSAMVTLAGWHESRGARLEVDVAHALGIPVTPIGVYIGAAS